MARSDKQMLRILSVFMVGSASNGGSCEAFATRLQRRRKLSV